MKLLCLQVLASTLVLLASMCVSIEVKHQVMCLGKCCIVFEVKLSLPYGDASAMIKQMCLYRLIMIILFCLESNMTEQCLLLLLLFAI